MNTPVLNIDLHCHSTVSDGALAPRDVAQRAHANGVDVWALTDHDEVGGLAEAAAMAGELGMRFATGVEISVTWAGLTVHIVGLRFDPSNAALVEGLRKTRSGRAERARRIGERLADMGMPGAYEGALPFAGNPELISRTHFARYLVEAGYCPDVQTVFTKHLGDDRPGHVPMQWATLAEAVGWIRGAGGMAVIAHPGRYKYTPLQFAALFDEFLQLGGVGIEVTTGSHTVEEARQYAEVARRYGFLASRGSDFHSPKESRMDLGRLPPLPPDLKPVWHDWF
ncbi:phosphatase [Achromobacter xylosoxidans]|jgi:3',5'-nucleoside bisphosphate phosphatase|uniref:3',5'-nucleoside bisphosphate phosphatase n=5 Tax=Achromobacter TaxID=222 RepID=A0ABM8M3Z8_9BURK|nr:3',5'-nucleoside bisphosphate phosphatase [Achromobacter ruhlandii]AKP90007.1 putative metal-dependent phosphoesterases (PHP family) [Achromobacter xylosoxidans]AOU93062.1 metal-dependent phosphoesterase TrpH [Achromobacter ruhlandii]MCI1840271.1 PHP domain-containing protein [Achromobacter ruhlandii]MCV6803999.1 PHP domain-containing protein [Achromobacter ruhlandii]MCV6811213.1 PHP domain-containing protein [Achromobacter ruhlandii]